MRSNRNIYAKGDESLHRTALELGVPSVEEDVGVFLEFFCKSARPKRILEIGCGIGVSSCYMAKGAPDADIFSVDHNRERLKEAAAFTAPYKNIKLIHSGGKEFMSACIDKFDLIFIDSVKKEYPLMLHYAEKLLNEGGTVIMDDVFVYGYIFCEDCEIPDKFRGLAQIFRDFLHRVRETRQHSILPIGGGLLLIKRT